MRELNSFIGPAFFGFMVAVLVSVSFGVWEQMRPVLPKDFDKLNTLMWRVAVCVWGVCFTIALLRGWR